MKFLDLFKGNKKNYYSQSGQDQFAYNLSGLNGYYLEIGAHHPIINSNTYILENDCNWKGISVEFDVSFMKDWDNIKERKNEVIWDDAFNINYKLLCHEKNLPNRINYLSCDIEPAENTLNILKKIIVSGLEFDFISFEHDKYNEGKKYDALACDFLLKNNYKVAVSNVYSRNKVNKIYETWYVHEEISFEELEYHKWKNAYFKKNTFKT